MTTIGKLNEALSKVTSPAVTVCRIPFGVSIHTSQRPGQFHGESIAYTLAEARSIWEQLNKEFAPDTDTPTQPESQTPNAQEKLRNSHYQLLSALEGLVGLVRLGQSAHIPAGHWTEHMAFKAADLALFRAKSEEGL